MKVAKLLALFLLLSCIVQAQTEDKSKEASEKSASSQQSAKRLEFMKRSVKGYQFLLAPDYEEKLIVEPEPLLRFTNPVSGLQDGGFFVWKSQAGRPMVGAQVFLTKDNLWIHEFQSLAPVAFRVTSNDKTFWQPNRAGVKVTQFPEAPPPAKTAVARLAQMRQMAERFIASDEFEGRPKSDSLRMLSKPLLRFGQDGSETLDGALFVHAHGTDPELMVVLEALKGDDGYHWHYALAPMTGYALQASLDDKVIWQVPWRRPPFDPKEPFFITVHSREITGKSLLEIFNR